MMTQRVILFLFCCCSALQLYAVEAVTAYTTFYRKVSQNKTYLPAIEVYWQANPATIHFNKNKEGLFDASLITIITISNDTGILVEEKFRFAAKPYSSLEAASAQNLADKYSYPLIPGNYKINITLYQQEYPEQAYQFNEVFTIAEYPANTPFLSGIQFIDTFFASDLSTIYSRNGNIEIPFPTNYFDETKHTLKFYSEIYQADIYAAEKRPLKLHSYISWKKFGGAIPGTDRYDTIGNNDIIPYHNSFDIASLPSGNYYLNTSIVDKNNKITDKQSTFFQRFNPNPVKTGKTALLQEDTSMTPVNVLDLSKTFVGKYNMSQVRTILKMLSVVSDPVETEAINAFLKRPDELYSKYFIYNFWLKRNPKNPEKPWKEYAERIKEVNKLFGTNTLAGFESDRGNTYIRYGKPNDRIIVNSETGAVPYEIWQYFAVGMQNREAIFLFYKPGSQLGDYILLHSTLPGERRNGKWRSFLYTNGITGAGTVNTNSQAEQYIGNK